MKRLHRFGGAAILAILAGCQAPDMELPMGEERAPQQLGLRIEFNPGFASRGILTSVPVHFGRAYADEGFLEFRIATVQNEGAEDLELFPILANGSTEEPAVTLHHRFWALTPRHLTREGRLISLGEVLPPTPPGDSLADYRADFDVEGGRVLFTNGISKTFPEDWGRVLNPQGVVIRAGETAEIRWKLRLRENTPLIASAPLSGLTGLDAAMVFYPPEIAATPAGKGRYEILISHAIRLASRQSFAVRKPGEDRIHPLYLDARFRRPEWFVEDRLARQLNRELNLLQPLESVRYRISGLPILL